MAVNLGTSTSNLRPFSYTQSANLFRLSDGTLVCFLVFTSTAYYIVSTNNGVSWSSPVSISSTRYEITAIPDGNDNFLLVTHQSSTGYVRAYSATYNNETNNFTISSEIRASDYGFIGRPLKAFYFDNLYWHFTTRTNYRNGIGFISSDKSSWSTFYTPVISNTSSNYCYCFDVVPIGTNTLLGVGNSANEGTVKFIIASKNEGTYEWGNWTTINNPTENPFYGTTTSLTLYKISDTEIWLAVRTLNGYQFYLYNGTNWSGPTQISNHSLDISGKFTKVNGSNIWAYIKRDESDNYGIYYRILKQSGWSSESAIISLQSEPIYRLSLEITENTEDILRYCYSKGASSPYNTYFDTFSLPEGEKFEVDESITISEFSQLKPSIEYLNLNELINVSEDIQSKVSNLYFNADEVIDLAEDIDSSTYRRVLDIEENLTVEDTQWFDSDKIINIEENIVISDEITTSLNKIDIYEEILVNDESFIGFPVILDSEEQIIVSDEAKARTSINYPYQIIAFNPLIVVSKTNPIRISIINVDDLDNIDWDGATIIPGVSDFNNITYNTLNECVYIVADSGKIIKIPVSDLGNQETISVSLFPNLKDSTVLSNRLQLYSISDNNTGELILLDEREMKSVSLDIKYVQEKVNFIPLDIRSIHSKNIPLNIIVLETNSKSIGLSFSFLKYAFDDASQYPIDYTKIQVKINNVDMSVLNDVDMSSIVITHNIESDKSNASFNLYRRFDDLNTTLNNVTSQITNKNTVQIFINGIKEFDGKISNLNVHTENEIVSVTCVGNRPKEQKNVVRIPFSRLNTNLHLYDCLLSNITMDNPPLDPDDETPEYYLGVEVDLGIRRTQQVQRWVSMNNALGAIEQGTFQPEQNWTYFWFVAVERFWTDWIGSRRSYTTISSYIGTSLSPAFSEDFKITRASFKQQKTYPDQESYLGFYRIGQAPYLPISAPNGMYISKDRWEDRPNGLYRVTDASFNFTSVARNHAQIEYEKLKNINGDILPRTSADVEITLDAYYFYNIKLLSRLNFSNTTKDNIYNKQNGFPVSVKLIVISTANMRVQLQTDNSLSSLEIDALEDKKVTTNSYEKDGSEGLENYKYDLVTGHKVV